MKQCLKTEKPTKANIIGTGYTLFYVFNHSNQYSLNIFFRAGKYKKTEFRQEKKDSGKCFS